MNCIIVDDEPLGRKAIQLLIQDTRCCLCAEVSEMPCLPGSLCRRVRWTWCFWISRCRG